MRKQLLIGIGLLSVLLGLTGCPKKMPQDTAAAFPKGFFLTNQYGKTFEDAVKTSKDGTFDQAEAEKLLTNKFRIVSFVDYTSASKKKAECYEMNNLDSIIVTPTQLPITTLTGRQFYGLESDLSITYVAQIGAKLAYKYMLEYQLQPTNPQYKLSFVVTPQDLMVLQNSYAERGRRFVALFSTGVLAPEMMMIHILKEAQADISFPVYFKANGGMFQELKRNFSNRFVLREYGNDEKVRDLFTNKNSVMFVEDSTKDVSYGDTIKPEDLVFEFNSKKYIVSSEYVDHLNAENVLFKNPKPAHGVSPTKTRSFEELTKDMTEITTEKFLIETSHPL